MSGEHWYTYKMARRIAHKKQHQFAACSVQGQHTHIVTKDWKTVDGFTALPFWIRSLADLNRIMEKKKAFSSSFTTCGWWLVQCQCCQIMCDMVTLLFIRRPHKPGQPVTQFRSVPSPWFLSAAACEPPVGRWGCRDDCGDTAGSVASILCQWTVGPSPLSRSAHPATQRVVGSSKVNDFVWAQATSKISYCSN